MVKNEALARRLAFAWLGIRFAFARERSFRTQSFLGLGALGALALLRPPVLWWALCLLSGGAVLAAELINTALEQLLDRLHPEQHDSIRVAKDCAAAAVLCLSIAAALVGVAMVLVSFGVLL